MLAAEKNIRDYQCAAGGCLLTAKIFSDKIRDYFSFADQLTMRDIPLLKLGRHFRLNSGEKVIVARNKQECRVMKNICRKNDHLLVPFDFTGPVVILQGHSLSKAVEKMLHYTKRSVNEKSRITASHGGKKRIVALCEI